jgi:hypothetical protein
LLLHCLTTLYLEVQTPPLLSLEFSLIGHQREAAKGKRGRQRVRRCWGDFVILGFKKRVLTIILKPGPIRDLAVLHLDRVEEKIKKKKSCMTWRVDLARPDQKLGCNLLIFFFTKTISFWFFKKKLTWWPSQNPKPRPWTRSKNYGFNFVNLSCGSHLFFFVFRIFFT